MMCHMFLSRALFVIIFLQFKTLVNHVIKQKEKKNVLVGLKGKYSERLQFNFDTTTDSSN